MAFCTFCGKLFDARDPLVNQRVGKFRLLERVGEGESSVVYRGCHVEEGGFFAVKILLPEYAKAQDRVARFSQEACVLSQLEHSSIVALADFGWTKDVGYYLAMEWVEGETVRDFLQRMGPLPKETILYMFTQLCNALEKAHQNGIVHRDLKLENLMLVKAQKGEVVLKVLDFGVAHVGRMGKHTTETGILVGTPRYMAPEQIREEKNAIDARTDVYACGLMLFEMLTGRPAFHKETVSQLLFGQLYEMPPYLNQLYPEGQFGESLENVVRKAIQKDRDMRYSSVLELRDALLEALLEEEVAVPQSLEIPYESNSTQVDLVARNPYSSASQDVLELSVGEIAKLVPS